MLKFFLRSSNMDGLLTHGAWVRLRIVHTLSPVCAALSEMTGVQPFTSRFLLANGSVYLGLSWLAFLEGRTYVQMQKSFHKKTYDSVIELWSLLYLDCCLPTRLPPFRVNNRLWSIISTQDACLIFAILASHEMPHMFMDLNKREVL